MPSNLIRDRSGTPPFVQPFLAALDRLQERRTMRPAEMTDRVRALLASRLGSSAGPVEAAFAHGPTGLLGAHTHYFDGFALLLSLPLGTAVAVRPAAGGRTCVVFEGSDRTWRFDAQADGDEAPAWARLVGRLAARLAPAGSPVDVAVVSTVHASCMDAYMAALGVATTRALQALFAVAEDNRTLLELVRELVAASIEAPFSIAYPIAADRGRPEVFSLVDTHTFEYLPLEAPSHEQLGWGLVDVGEPPLRGPAFYRERQAEAEEALGILQRGAFPQLRSLRDLEHRDLERALQALPGRLRPLVRHLVTDNRRVQKMVAAVRRQDWQMFGALFLMSHASFRPELDATTEAIDFVVEQVEGMSIEGMYGACTTGRGGCVLVVGQPFIVPRCLDRIQESLRDRFGIMPDVVLL